MGMTGLPAEAPTGSTTPPVALTVAGTDSGGSAGLAADLKSFAANGVHGVFAVTLVTAQNSTGIVEAQPLAPELIASQLDAVCSDFRVAASKTGMLYTEAAIDVVAQRTDRFGPLVVDPVLVSSAGTPLFERSLIDAYVDRLFPRSALITPNVAEARLLSGRAIDSREALARAAGELLELGPGAVLVTGYHDGDSAIDALARDGDVSLLDHELVETDNVLGTGCSLSATIAARLAAGDELLPAIMHARAYVLNGLRSGAHWALGSGRGPIDHFARRPGLR